MATTIDIENAKQIRQPMDVEISINLPDTGGALTYSGYTSSAKVADGVLGESSWPMRVLTDLQGDGFPLDGSCSLYDSTVTASAANGKIGVRGNVGQNVDVTISRSTTIASVEVRATGATSVTYGGTTYSLADGSASVIIGSTSATLTFACADANNRVEVSFIGSTSEFYIRNDTLIRAVVSLRSDLSRYDQTLPESEINVEAFVSTDISSFVAGVPEDTVLTYSAGYEEDMSPIRRFYVSGQVTWADNVLTIHAVDAVHFLDVETFPMFIGYNWGGEWYPTRQGDGFWPLYEAFKDQLRMSQIAFAAEPNPPMSSGYTTNSLYSGSIVERQNRRDLLANMMGLFHYQGSSGDFWLNYVDAGRPSLSRVKPTKKWTINEEDCADVKKQVEPEIKRIIATIGTVEQSGTTATREAGSGTLLSGSNTAFFDYQQLCIDAEMYAEKEGVQPVWVGFTGYDDENTVLPVTVYVPSKSSLYGTYYGKFLLDNDIGTNGNAAMYDSVRPQEKFPWSMWSSVYVNGSIWNTIVSRGIAEAGDSSCALTLIGRYFIIDEKTNEIINTGTTGGITVKPEKTKWIGKVYKLLSSTSATNVVAQCFRNIFKTSNVTGSFVWKGDPRMQPRDVVGFKGRDGNTNNISLENITLTHEGGGTKAEITYRKGIV